MSKYADHIETAVGGRPDEKAVAAEECVKRSPVTYLARASGVNLDINAGVSDGRSGSVPFTHSLQAFNAVVAEAERLSPEFIREFYTNQKAPEGTPEPRPDPLYGNKPILFRKISGNTRVTIFQGGHEIINRAALNWLAAQRKGASEKGARSPGAALTISRLCSHQPRTCRWPRLAIWSRI